MNVKEEHKNVMIKSVTPKNKICVNLQSKRIEPMKGSKNLSKRQRTGSIT